MIGQLNIYGEDKVETAIKRIKMFEPEEGYYLSFSGGKDSVTVKALIDMANVKYDAHYNVTSVDPPELVQFIKREHPDVIFEYPTYRDGTRTTIWNLIPRKKDTSNENNKVLLRVTKRGWWEREVRGHGSKMGRKCQKTEK